MGVGVEVGVGDGAAVGSGVGDGLGDGVGVGIEVGVGFGVAVPGSTTMTDWTLDDVASPPSPTVRPTTYVPDAAKWWTGADVVAAGDPSPKSHDQVVGEPAETS